MGRAWPRYLPGATAEAIVCALLIEAHAILVEQLADARQDLIEAHDRAASYARTHYTPDEVRAAWNACAATAGNENILLYYAADVSAVGAEIETQMDQEFGIAA
jgi:hypothetical protein